MSDSPRIYVASLSDYNAGRLYGRWIDADQEPEDIQAEIDAMLASSPTPGAEEWEIHDSEGFGSWAADRYGLPAISAMARGISEHGGVFAEYCAHIGADPDDALRSFPDAYQGAWNSAEEWAEELATDIGYTESDNPLLAYVDWERWARDLLISDYWEIVINGEHHIFRH